METYESMFSYWYVCSMYTSINKFTLDNESFSRCVMSGPFSKKESEIRVILEMSFITLWPSGSTLMILRQRGKYYHPSNAKFWFYGDDPADARLELVDKYLSEFEKIEVRF